MTGPMNAPDPVLAGLACALALGCFGAQALVNVAFVVAIVLMISRIEVEKTRTLQRLTGIDGALILYVIAFVLSAMMGVSPDESFPYVTELKRPLIAYVIASSLSSRRDAVMVAAFAVLGASLSSLVAFKQYFFGASITLHRVKYVYAPYQFKIPIGLSSSNNDLATLLAMALGLAAVPLLFFTPRLPRWAKIACTATTAIIFAGLLRTLSRSGLLAALVAFAFIGLLLRPKRVLVVLLALVIGYPFLSEELRMRHHDIFTLKNYSNWYRVRLVEISGEILKDHFLWGVGRKNFPKMHHKLRKPGEDIAPHAHNNYLQLLVENGIAGLIAFIWFQVGVIVFAIRRLLWGTLPEMERALLGGALMGVIAFSVNGVFHYTWGDAMPCSFLWVAVGLVYAIGEGRTTPAPQPATDEPSSAASTEPS
jgi:O-antigen ligase